MPVSQQSLQSEFMAILHNSIYFFTVFITAYLFITSIPCIEILGQLGLSLGLTEPEIAEQQASAQAVIDSINKADLKKVELKEAIAAKELQPMP
jgi:hypothetical protein